MKPQQIRKEREDVECDRIRSVGKSGRLAYVGVTVVERGAVLVGLGLVEGCLNAGHLGPIEGTYGRKRYLTTRQAGKQANRQAGKQASRQKNKQGLVSKSGRAHRPIATAFATRGCTTSRPANEGTNED